MKQSLLTLALLAGVLSPLANASANQRSCSTSVPLSMTINYGDNLNTNCHLTQVGQVALFLFQGNTGDEIAISLDSSWFNGPCADLYGPTNALVKSACNTSSYYNAASLVTLTMTGQYTIRVHDVGNTNTGTFGLMLDRRYPVAVATPLTVGISSNGNTVHGETIDDWTFYGTVGEDVVVQVQSAYFNGPCLTLVGPTGVQSSQVCNTGSYYQARGEYTLSATGTYAVIVNSVGFSTGGTYSVIVQCVASCSGAPPTYVFNGFAGNGRSGAVLYDPNVGQEYSAVSNGDGTFQYVPNLFTGDGKADLFLYNSNNGLAFMGVGDGAGNFAFNPLFISPGYTLADIGDLNGDSKLDLILYNPTSGNAATGISDGLGGLNFTPLIFSSGFTSVRLADYTGDGKADVTVYNKNTAAAYFGTGTGLGTFNFQSLFWSPSYDSVQPEDVNGDGKMDVVLYNSLDGTEYTGISNGNGTFSYTYKYWGIGKMLAR